MNNNYSHHYCRVFLYRKNKQIKPLPSLQSNKTIMWVWMCLTSKKDWYNLIVFRSTCGTLLMHCLYILDLEDSKVYTVYCIHSWSWRISIRRKSVAASVCSSCPYDWPFFILHWSRPRSFAILNDCVLNAETYRQENTGRCEERCKHAGRRK